MKIIRILFNQSIEYDVLLKEKQLYLRSIFILQSKPYTLKNYLHLFSRRLHLLLFAVLTVSSLSAQWVQLNDAPFRDDHTNGFGFEDHAFLFRGSPTNNGGGNMNEVWTYTPATDEWNLLTNFPGAPRNISIGDDWDDKYYYGFGIGGPNGLLNDLWVFDPVDTSFTELPSCPCVGRSHPSLIAHNDKIYMGAGSSFGGDLKDWWEYDILTQVWTRKEDIPGDVRHHMFHFSIGKYIYVGGGHVNNWNRYDPDTETWTSIDDLPQGRVAGTQFQYNGLGFILAGDNRFHDHVPDFETFMYYSEDTKEWDYLPPLPNGSRWAPSSFIVNGEVYFATGLSTIVNGGDQTMWKFDLETINCLPPSGLNAVDIQTTSAGIFWSTNSESVSDTLKWRKVGDEIWNDVIDAKAVHQLEDLEACTDYEYLIVKSCESKSTSSAIQTFRTDGCCLNPELNFTSITPSSALVEWPPITAADEYNIRWRQLGEEDWNTQVVLDGPYQLTNLEECTEYEFQIESVCVISDIEYSESRIFTTGACGACLDETYCSVKESFSAEYVYINKVQINDYVNETGNNGGYANFEDAKTTEVLVGGPFSFSFEPGYEGGSFAFTLQGWIDLNANGVFENNEKLIQQSSVSGDVSIAVLIPQTAVPGLTRMRIMYSNETDPCSPDDNFVFGEVEDYCLTIQEQPTATIDLSQNEMIAYPNPFVNDIILKDSYNDQRAYDVSVINLVGEVVYTVNGYTTGQRISMPDHLNAGVYFMIVSDGDSRMKLRIVKR